MSINIGYLHTFSTHTTTDTTDDSHTVYSTAYSISYHHTVKSRKQCIVIAEKETRK